MQEHVRKRDSKRLQKILVICFMSLLVFVGFTIQPEKLHGGLILDQFGYTGVYIYCLIFGTFAILQGVKTNKESSLFYAFFPVIVHMIAVISFVLVDAAVQTISGNPKLPSVIAGLYIIVIYGLWHIRE